MRGGGGSGVGLLGELELNNGSVDSRPPFVQPF